MSWYTGPGVKCLRPTQIAALRRAFKRAKFGDLPKPGHCKRLARGFKGTQGEVCHDVSSRLAVKDCYFLVGVGRSFIVDRMRARGDWHFSPRRR